MGKQLGRILWWISIMLLLVAILGVTSACTPPLRVEVHGRTPPRPGEKITLVADVSGGNPPFKYQWKLISGPGKLLPPTTDPSVFYEATEAGDVTVQVEVTSNDGGGATKSYSFTVESRPTPTLTQTPIMPPTETPTLPTATSTPAPQPVVRITKPVDTVNCQGQPLACRFTVEGTSSGVLPNPDMRIWVFVYPIEPPGQGWYPQKPPATIWQDGKWLQSPSWIGCDEVPAESGDTLQIVAVVAHKDAAWNDIKLSEWPGDIGIPSYWDVAPQPLAASEPVILRVAK